MDFYHYMMVVYRHCQHTFQYNQLVKVHVPLYDPFNPFIPEGDSKYAKIRPPMWSDRLTACIFRACLKNK